MPAISLPVSGALSREPLETPVVFLIFNRPSVTTKSFASVRAARPKNLYVVADGPRLEHPGDGAACEKARAVVEAVDWPCVVETNYSSVNLGCRGRVASGLSWAFERTSEAIILEDDCVPHPNFFHYAESLLRRYRDDERIMSISGFNPLGRTPGVGSSYHFTRQSFVWGWATWRRAWSHYDLDMKRWPEFRDGDGMKVVHPSRRAARYWSRMMELTYQCKIDTWDYQWYFACWLQNGLWVIPTANLVRNIGFSPDATHTTRPSPLAAVEAVDVSLPLVHPTHFLPNDGYTEAFLDIVHPPLISKTRTKAWRLLDLIRADQRRLRAK